MYPQSMFGIKNKNIRYTPVLPRSHWHLRSLRTLQIGLPYLSVLSVTIRIISVKSVSVRALFTGHGRSAAKL